MGIDATADRRKRDAVAWTKSRPLRAAQVMSAPPPAFVTIQITSAMTAAIASRMHTISTAPMR
jgi:hypothetical protein